MKRTPSYDYVIAGAGSAGCVLAARLAEDPLVRVCLVEAGGDSRRNLFIRMPAGNGLVFGHPKLDWGYASTPQQALNDRLIYFPRGKGLGGTSGMNGMTYMRGVPKDYDNWAKMGLAGWSFTELMPYFLRSECSQNRSGPWHGYNGPLKTEPAVNFGVLEKAFVEAAVAAGHRWIDDINGPVRTGVARSDSTIYKGVRQTTASSFLHPKPNNLTIITHKQIHRVCFEGQRAVGLQTIDGETIRAEQEVIICNGAFGTPQTLMLSGIGPADHLAERGIKTRADLAGVGSNLLDHIDVCMQYGSDRLDLSLARHQRLDKATLLMAHWLFNGGGPGGGAFFSTTLFHALDDPEFPEFEVYMTPMVVDDNLVEGANEKTPLLQRLGKKLLVRGHKMATPGVQIDLNLERPRSMGTVRLANDNPLTYPVIDPNYLSDPYDLRTLVKGVKAMRDVMAMQPIAQHITGELGAWRDVQTDAEIIQAIRATAYTGHHVSSTARMGNKNDAGAVLDDQLRVRGVENLRVCDASAMPTQLTGNINATVIAMAEKAADMMLGKPPLPPVDPRRQ